MNIRTALASAALATTLIGSAEVSTARADAPPAEGSLAVFEGRLIDLSISWEQAHACYIGDSGNNCFRTEAELEGFLADQGSLATQGQAGPLASCGTALSLWDGTNKTGDVLSLSQRLIVLSLANYGFAERTSSYRIGSCSAVFRDASSSVYPGNTSAGASANSMVSGWNNRVTSVYIA